LHTRRKNYSGKRKRTPVEQSHRCGFTEDDIREKFAQEELWDGEAEESERDAIQSLMDAGEYDNAAKLANEASYFVAAKRAGVIAGQLLARLF
jgi:hypothetical protein